MVITDEGYIEVEITADMRDRAAAKAAEMGRLRNSIRKGAGNLAGFLGEEVVLAGWCGALSSNTFNHDVTFDDEFGDVSFEVKSKDRTVYPDLEFEASVANYNTRQKADFYVFTSLLRDKATNLYVRGWVLGIIAKKDYFEQARFLREGDYDPTNNWYCKANCHNLPYSKLTRFAAWRMSVAA